MSLTCSVRLLPQGRDRASPAPATTAAAPCTPAAGCGPTAAAATTGRGSAASATGAEVVAARRGVLRHGLPAREAAITLGARARAVADAVKAARLTAAFKV